MKTFIDEKQVDWAFVIRNHLVSIGELDASKFPYACLLTNVFTSHTIDLERE